MTTPLLRFFGSIQFAIPLLCSIGAVLIGATLYESQVGSTTVQHLIYKSPWFGMLMFLLAINLLISALTRYPWRGPRKIGFALTHVGLVLVIIGSAGVIHLSLEGMLPLKIDQPANNRIRIEGDLLEVVTAQGLTEQTDIFIRPDGSISPSSVLGLSLLDYSENTVKTVRFRQGGAIPNLALKFRLTSQRMGQNLEQWLALAPIPYRTISLGPATLEIVSLENDEQALAKISELSEKEIGKTDYFQAIATNSGKLYYATRSSQSFQSGILEPGKPINPGWADLQITLEDSITNAEIDRQVIPAEGIEGTPAILVETENSTQQWLPWGEPTAISEPDGDLLAAFTPKFFQLPFQVALQDFIVDRNEGSDSVAMWTSKIEIIDPDGHTISDRTVWMNHPTWYHGWKLAQASWNPGDLQQSTLQVKREPLWITLLTWSGSALVVAGIGTMFYGKAILKRFSPTTEKQPIPVEANSTPSSKETVTSVGAS